MQSDIFNKIAQYFENRPEVVAVYLFGSYASGREKKQSDIDLGVLLEQRMLPSKRDLETAYTIGLAKLLRKDFHIVIMNDAGEGILAQIFKRGRCVFQQNPESLSRFKTVSYSLIADFGYHRSLMERAFVSRIMGNAQ
jgi:predicted nucleotidyltransferase